MKSLELTFRIIIGDLIMPRKYLMPEQIEYVKKAIEYLKKALEVETQSNKEQS